MANSRESTIVPATVPHPGETVREYLEFHMWSQRDLARRTNLTPKTISKICSGKASITARTALAFEKALQRPAHLWLNLQCQFDEAEARRRSLSSSLKWREWTSKFPIQDMKRLKYSLPEGYSDTDALLNYFGVASPASWSAVWNSLAVAYRQATVSRPNECAIAAWIREVEIIAKQINLNEFNEDKLNRSLGDLRLLTRRQVSHAVDDAQRICASSGIALVLVPGLLGTGISGCTRWLTDKQAIIGLTLRYKTDDHFWFTFFHELGHVLLHRRKQPFVVDNVEEVQADSFVDENMRKYEAEANRFSADTMIPPIELARFLVRNDTSSASIHEFAQAIGIGPGIVVGRLQFERVIQFWQGNQLKQNLDWNFKEGT